MYGYFLTSPINFLDTPTSQTSVIRRLGALTLRLGRLFLLRSDVTTLVMDSFSVTGEGFCSGDKTCICSAETGVCSISGESTVISGEGATGATSTCSPPPFVICGTPATSPGTSLTSPVGARSLIDTVDSLPLAYHINAYCGFASNNSTSSTKGSCLLCLTNLLSNTGPGTDSHVGSEVPVPDFLWNWNILS